MDASRRLGVWVARKTRLHSVDRRTALSLGKMEYWSRPESQVFGKERRGRRPWDEESQTNKREQEQLRIAPTAQSQLHTSPLPLGVRITSITSVRPPY